MHLTREDDQKFPKIDGGFLDNTRLTKFIVVVTLDFVTTVMVSLKQVRQRFVNGEEIRRCARRLRWNDGDLPFRPPVSWSGRWRTTGGAYSVGGRSVSRRDSNAIGLQAALANLE
jgi:hypothetical protein